MEKKPPQVFSKSLKMQQQGRRTNLAETQPDEQSMSTFIDVEKISPHILMKAVDRQMNLTKDQKLALFEANWIQYRQKQKQPPAEKEVSKALSETSSQNEKL